MMGKTHKSCALVEDMTKMSIAIKGGPRKSLGGRGMFDRKTGGHYFAVVVVGVGLSNRHRHGGTSCQPLHDTERLQFINSIRKDKASLYTRANKRKLLCYYPFQQGCFDCLRNSV
ncbi:unnamed protein product [Brassica oleracea]|uniref:Uncharacterized protein n=1 Tax=Brassica oleracea TaxID=3712 RepID=A0A3P6EKG2_BRAOL|nr:unnamed protein product [Brassica oleracea]